MSREIALSRRRRNTNAVAYDANRSLDFVLNNVTDGKKQFEIKPTILKWLSQAKRSVYIEMAYIGDPDISRKIIEVASHGVEVTVLFSREANIGNDINYKSMHDLNRRAEIEAFLTRKWSRELDYRLIKEVWVHAGPGIAVLRRFLMAKWICLVMVVMRRPPSLG